MGGGCQHWRHQYTYDESQERNIQTQTCSHFERGPWQNCNISRKPDQIRLNIEARTKLWPESQNIKLQLQHPDCLTFHERKTSWNVAGWHWGVQRDVWDVFSCVDCLNLHLCYNVWSRWVMLALWHWAGWKRRSLLYDGWLTDGWR